MTRIYKLRMPGWVALFAVVPLLASCAWRGPETGGCGEGGAKAATTETAAQPAANAADLKALQDRLAELEKRLGDNEKLAQEANATADKALKCCRKDYTILMTEEIYFDFNKYDVRTEDYPALDRVGEKLKADPDLIAEIGGYTDSVGTSDYNIVLGQKRADAARSYLTSKHNINYGRIAIRTFGKAAAANPPSSDVNKRRKDRRVTIDVLGYAK